jgi:predicted helicase
MMPSQRETLRNIRTFSQLIKFLRDELAWPIESEDFEELTFDYTPEELGIDTANAAKIQDIKRLRPLSAGQPWGIFFVKFEPKRLPVVALRRVLSRVVLKKRASANSAERTAWQADDLLFISNYGEGDERQISFAHFSQDGEKTDLPTLKVLGWDNLDTRLHLDDVAETLRQRLAWPTDLKDTKRWRQTWRSAFTLRHLEVITTSKELAIRLADLARAIRARIQTVLSIETENGQLTKLMKAFQQALIHGLSADDFADMYAQTITYGLLSARVTNPTHDTADAVATHIPITNPFLKELMETFLHLGGRRHKARGGDGIDFDELGVSDVVELLDAANMEAVIRDFGDRNRVEDPVIHFYELFLKEYDPQKRMQRGVFYTPQPVVSYIVGSVHELLQTEFGLEDGLASTVTWAEMAKRHKDLKIPDGVAPESAFVQILDPATGTATFLVEVIDVIHRTLSANWKQQRLTEAQQRAAWNDYVPKYLLPRLHGYELMMAPYAIAHMKIGLELYETGYRFGSDERARIYLTNALEPPSDNNKQREFEEWAPALAHEAQAVNAIKRQRRFTVVIGNPPYSVTSANFNPFIDALMDDYKKHVRGEQGLVALADDYLKFIRISQELLRTSHCGIWGMITNHSYLKGVIHRGVRRELLSQFSSMFVLDLHGDSNIGERSPEGKSNENVFDIQQGVAITIGSQPIIKLEVNSVRHSDLWGNRTEKYDDLAHHSLSQRSWTELHPKEPRYLLIPFDDANLVEYQQYPSIDDLMPVNSCGVKTHRDGVVIDYDKKTLIARMSDIAREHRIGLLRERYGISDTPHWRLKEAQAKIKAADVPNFVHRLTYRPFDYRWIYYNRAIIEKGDSKYPTLRHMLESNRALLTARIQATGIFDAVFISKFLVEMKTAESSRSCTVFPLYLTEESDSQQRELDGNRRRPNLNPRVLRLLAQKLGLKTKEDFGLPESITPEDILQYAYGIFHSPGYRSRYAEFLKSDFPRLPLTGDLELFHALVSLGGKLVALHLLESPKLDKPLTTYTGPANPEIEKVAYARDTVWLEKAQTCGFCGVPETVWNFHIGGYQVCEKWLKDRKGRTLSKDDIAHYQKIVVALSETIRLMKQIDEVIDKHGGWPGAFAGPRN